ncbi:MAG: hypothetical protein C4531_11815 [Desulfurivibrio sp.]|nr:MAG: hypothetical protein C4531_11815 [Desulfurivibrio sp.]
MHWGFLSWKSWGRQPSAAAVCSLDQVRMAAGKAARDAGQIDPAKQPGGAEQDRSGEEEG